MNEREIYSIIKNMSEKMTQMNDRKNNNVNTDNRENVRGFELLAPAGSLEIFKAVIAAGADAVYVGGDLFGARAYANNFSEEELLEAIDYAHLFGRKVYLTVNTLVKEREFDQLYGYLLPYYKQGLDAVIVQDMGVMEYIRRQFPEMDIHASTQMTVTNVISAEWLEKQGFEVTYVDVDENGIVRLDELEKAITPETILISVMFANNEIGSIQPIKEIGRIAKEHGILFHTDAVQAFCQVPIDVDECNIDMLSSSGHKINGPKGIGFLYIRKGVKIRSFVHGGAQERKRRAGTENVPGIVGYGAAAERAMKNMKERTEKEIELRDYLINRLTTEIPYSRLNGDRVKRLPNNVNVSFQFIEGESMLLMLDQNGICASSGSACTSGSLDPSHVLLAIGVPHEVAHGSLRLTLSEETTKEDIDFTVDKLKEIVPYLRSMSPLYEDFMKKHQQ